MDLKQWGGVGLLRGALLFLVPLVGAYLLNFYFKGPSAEEQAQASQTPAPARTQIQAATASAPRPTAIATPLPTATPSPTPQPTEAAVSTPTSRPSPSPQPTETVPPPRDVNPGTRAKVNATDGLRVRESSSTTSRVIRVARFEEEVVLSGESAQEGAIQWVRLQAEGWVQARYLDFAAE